MDFGQAQAAAGGPSRSGTILHSRGRGRILPEDTGGRRPEHQVVAEQGGSVDTADARGRRMRRPDPRTDPGWLAKHRRDAAGGLERAGPGRRAKRRRATANRVLTTLKIRPEPVPRRRKIASRHRMAQAEAAEERDDGPRPLADPARSAAAGTRLRRRLPNPGKGGASDRRAVWATIATCA